MNSTKYYNISDLIKLSGLTGNELRYLIWKNNIKHKIIRTRKYFSVSELRKIMIEAKNLYPNTKKQKAIIDCDYRVENLIKRLSKLASEAKNLIKN
jgi:hypothetical protein